MIVLSTRSALANTIHLVLAGTQSGYSVTWGTVTTNFDGGSGRVILYFLDGSDTTYSHNDILLLSGTSINDVISIEFHAISGMEFGRGFDGYISGSFAKHVLTGITYSEPSGSFYGKDGTFVLGEDVEITTFSIRGED